MARDTVNVNGNDPVRIEASDWLLRVEAAPDDTALAAALADWLSHSERHRAAFESVQRMWFLSSALAPDFADHAEVVQTPAISASRRYAPRFAIALSLAACIAVAFLPTINLSDPAVQSTGTGEIRRVSLADGSTAFLDAESAIAVHYEQNRRHVTLLSGQAFFDVVKIPSRPFIVTARKVRATVTGTNFAMSRNDTEIVVSLKSGSVDVSLDDGAFPVETLSPGDRLSVHVSGRRFEKATLPVDDIAAWPEHRLTVHGATLASVTEILSRYHRGLILLPDKALASRRVTGTFDLKHPIEALHAAVRAQHGSITALTPYLLIVSDR